MPTRFRLLLSNWWTQYNERSKNNDNFPSNCILIECGHTCSERKCECIAGLRVRPDDGSKALFVSQKGGAMSREHVHRIFKSGCERAGIPRPKRFVHILKHSRATHLVGTMDVALLRQLMGHKKIQNTMIYAHASDAQACKAALEAEMHGFRKA